MEKQSTFAAKFMCSFSALSFWMRCASSRDDQDKCKCLQGQLSLIHTNKQVYSCNLTTDIKFSNPYKDAYPPVFTLYT